MKTRPMEERDFEALTRIYDQAGLRFPMPDLSSPMIEAAEVVVDDRDQVILGGVAQRTAEVYLFCPPSFHPLVKMEAVGLLHGAIRDTIVPKGYLEAFAFVQPGFQRFGRHLTKWFGWERTWPCYRIRDWAAEPRKEG